LLTSASSAETPAPVDDAPELAVAAALALLGEAAGVLLVDVLGVVVELLDEHAASSTAATTARPPNAALAAR
jgi:hypothetical protein